jgi:2-polyprenyl-3-methyl-5-hydroxy-6-metoxy-1,4-benzoquinol methylase
MLARQQIPEIMDDPGLDRLEHEAALRGLGRINRFSRSAAWVWGPIAQLARSSAGHRIRVLDLACGGGDVARAIARKAVAKNLPIEVQGTDISVRALEFAARCARQDGMDVRFFQLDAVTEAIPDDFDVLLCTLFLHHLSGPKAAQLLGSMAAAARKLVLVDDLVRSRAGYAIAWAGCRLLTRSRVNRYDGPASVLGAFRVAEVRSMAEAAGLSGASIRRHWPERFLLSWRRP